MTRESPFASTKVPVAVLGATGAVGQAFVRLLASHPWFELAEVAASERSAGLRIREAALPGPAGAVALTGAQITGQCFERMSP